MRTLKLAQRHTERRASGVVFAVVALVATTTATAMPHAAAQEAILQRYAVDPKPVEWTVSQLVDNEPDGARYLQYFASGQLIGGTGALPQQVAYEAYPKQQSDASQVKSLIDEDGWTSLKLRLGPGAFFQRGSYGQAVVSTKTALFVVSASLPDMSATKMTTLLSTVRAPKGTGSQLFAVNPPKGTTRQFAGQLPESRPNWTYIVNTPNGRIGVRSVQITTPILESRIIGFGLRTTVNGLPGVEDDSTLIWMASPSQYLILWKADTKTPKGDLFAIAQMLRPISQEAWAAYGKQSVPTTATSASTDLVWGDTDTLPWKVSAQMRGDTKCFLLTIGSRNSQNCLPTTSSSPVLLAWNVVSFDGSLFFWVVGAPSVTTVAWTTKTGPQELTRVNLKPVPSEGFNVGVVRMRLSAGDGEPSIGTAVGYDAAGTQVTPPMAGGTYLPFSS